MERRSAMPQQPDQPTVLRKMFSRGFEKKTSSPENDEYRRIIFEEQLPRVHGGPAKKKKRFRNASAAAADIKRFAFENGADRAAICRINPLWVYKGIEVPHEYGIVLLQSMDYERISTAPEAAAGIEATRVYMTLGETTVRVGEHVRSLGYEAMIHHPRGDRDSNGELMFVPHAASCGLGEHGRNGLLINSDFGPRVRLGMVSTDLELVVDPPRDGGIAKFCEFCLKCLNACPTRAIPVNPSMIGGYDKFTIDVDRCAPMFEKTDGCSICIKDCTFNQPTMEATRARVEWVASWYEVVKSHPGWPHGL